MHYLRRIKKKRYFKNIIWLVFTCFSHERQAENMASEGATVSKEAQSLRHSSSGLWFFVSWSVCLFVGPSV
jgi:hypothetical protein